MKYKEFFQIAINHQYFSDDRMDLMLIPEANTLQFLRKQHFIVKNTPKGLKVLIPVDIEGDQLPIIEARDTLRFNVASTTDNFDDITDINKEISFFTNEGLENNSEELVVSKPTEGDILNGFTIAKVKIKLSEVNFGSAKVPPEYQLIFKSKSVKWKYYIVSNTETTKLEIKDRGEQLTFSELKNQDDKPDKIARSLRLNFPDKRLFVFESSTAINYSNKILKNIQLLKNENIIIKHLSNPSISDNGIQIIKIN
ncbi:MAG: hypothetical protein ABJL44_00105 [Algibacter sp.]